jgi:hypothetical protein
MSELQEDLTFDEAIDKFRDTFLKGGMGTPEYQDALNTISFLWDYKRAEQINYAIAPTYARKQLTDEPDFVFILMNLRNGGTYCVLHRNQWATWM